MRAVLILKLVRRQLWVVCLKVSYWYALFVGLMPAPLNFGSRKFRRSRTYLAYSAAMHALCLSSIPLVFPNELYSNSYMSSRQTLQWAYTLSGASKVLAFIAIVQMTWSERQHFTELFYAYSAFLQRYRHFQPSSGEAKQRVVERVQRLLVWKFICGHAVLVLNCSILFKMNEGLLQLSYVLMVSTNLFITTFLMTATHQLAYALCQLRCQFVFINAALREMRLQLLPQCGCSCQTPHALETRFAALRAMHWDCYLLARRVFRLFETPFAAVLLRTFSLSISIIFHAVQFVSQRITADASSTANGSALVLVFFLDSTLIVTIVEGVVAACNETGPLLREYSDLAHLRRHKDLLREVDIFSTYLSGHQLTYNVCGLFEFNKGLSLRCILTALVKATVLMQFDMKVK